MDGVLNHEKMFQGDLYENVPPGNLFGMTVDPKAVTLLKNWCQSWEVDIVASTSWRSNTMDAGEWQNPKHNNFSIFNAIRWGGWPEEDLLARLIGNTPRIWGAARGLEIKKWLDEHPDRYRKDITPFIILDDNADMTLHQKKNHFVQTKMKDGLMKDHIEKMTEVLEAQKKKPAQKPSSRI